MSKYFPPTPPHPERICWGCDKYCSVDALACGNGSERTQHPSELFGDDWLEPILPFDAAEASTDTARRATRRVIPVMSVR